MQLFFETISFAVRSIRSYKLRAFLTMFGISIGVFAITIVFTLVNSMQYSISKNLSSLGNTVLFVHNWPWKDNSDDWYKYFNRPKVSYSDYQRLKKNLPNAEAVSFVVTKNNITAKIEKRTAENLNLKGITYEHSKIDNFEFQEGRFFTPVEVENGRNVCLLGAQVAESLFGKSPCLNEEISVNGRRLKIVGVIQKKGKNLFGDNQDEYFLIPFTLFSNMYNVSQRQIDKVIACKATSYEKFGVMEGDVVALMRLNRGLKPGTEDNFAINKQENLMKELGSFFNYLNAGGAVISIFSLIIGGFGIANIMFVTVKERTKEIGIQKALGASRRFILMQFLMEAIILCLIGGLIGIVFVFMVAAGIQFGLKAGNIGMEVVILAKDIFIALGLSASIGILSGFLPSLLASRLNPVDAIRTG